MSRLLVTLTTAAVVTLSLTTPAAQAADTPAPSGLGFTSVDPTRILDTRNNPHKVNAYSDIQVHVPEELVPADATALVFNLTGTDTDGATWVAAGTTVNTSNLNLAAGETRANLVTAALDKGLLDLRVGPGSLNVVVDVEGYYSPGGSGYTAVAGHRVLDTRTTGPVGPQGTITVDLSAQVPAGATAAVFNLTGTDVSRDTFVTAYPAGQQKPDASTLNLAAGKNTPNLVTVKLGADRKVSLTNAFGSVDLIADLAGYYSADSASRFYPLAPFRALDTRDADGNPRESIPGGGVHETSVRGWLPDQSTGVVLNVTGTNVSASTFLKVWPSLTPQPDTSVLNLEPGQTSANAAVVALSPSHGLEIGNLAGQADAIVDIAGYFAPSFLSCTVKCVVTTGYNDTGNIGVGSTDRGVTHGSTTAFGLSDVTQVTSTGNVTLALTSAGRVYAWGDNVSGRLGNGLAGRADAPDIAGPEVPSQGYYNPIPERVQILSSVKIVAITHGFALDDFGNVYAWGSNTYGTLGTGQPLDYVAETPERVDGLSHVTAIVGGGRNGYALKSDGSVWAWGDNAHGELGNGSHIDQSSVPVKASGLPVVKAISAGAAVTSDGSVWQWGENGDGAVTDPPAPVSGLTGVNAVATTQGWPLSTHYALKSDGTVWAWGYQGGSALGDGSDCSQTSCDSATPAQIQGLASVTQLAAGGTAGFALRTDGTVWAWGHASEGEFGDGVRFQTVPKPRKIESLAGIVSIGDSGAAVRG
ncbi:hypothetical protein [Kutzneria sp. 744]|uniref:RCC1 domain-containing protein n=1 Tax=Kutzneria sp. (strain 744) TaxID=345341 RepID=UPI0003EEDAED|nr:hypothetical protein [Kutzneria sp. 744]EWM14432.1 RCC1 repeat protein [Kutzneria sp. 744]